ncbi:MAG: hypothetical protein JWQ04_2825, partial [Pedosphaera sp.]|nr:hypothetical protein [Pedosphaera sp.]
MNQPAAISKTVPGPINGTLADVAAFFRLSERTVERWTTRAEGTPELAHWQEDRRVMIPESAVVEKYVRNFRAAKGLKPGELEERARRDW